MKKLIGLPILALILCSCTYKNLTDKFNEVTAPDYVNSSKAEKLQLPPDLSEYETSNTYNVPGAATSYKDFEIQRNRTIEKVELLKNLDEGQIVKGVVKNLTDYGAFVDLGGLDGLLHITDISWSRVTNPSEVLSLGQEIDVKILSFDKEKLRVSLGLKQIQNDPWETIEGKYSVGGVYEATVSNLTDYGCFAELEQGVEGLIHLSELDWTNKNIHPSKVVDLEEKIKVMVLEIDHDKRRISLGLKQTKANPWTEFANKYGLGDSVEGSIKSVTDFGIFVGLEGDIDGLIHLSDITEDENPAEAMENYKKGDKLSCIIFGIDAERERISLKLSA